VAATTTGELIGVGRRRGRGIEWVFASFSSFQTHLRHGRQKLWDPDQIVCDGGKDKEPFDQVTPTMPALSQAAGRLDPAEGLFDPLSLDHADGITRIASRATIDRRAAMGVVLRDMRSAAAFAAAGDEVSSIVEFVGPHRAAGFGIVLDHVERRGVLGGAVGLGQPGINDEIVPVLNHQMAHVIELGLAEVDRRSRQSCGRVGSRPDAGGSPLEQGLV
jgi:hypothetical protein